MPISDWPAIVSSACRFEKNAHLEDGFQKHAHQKAVSQMSLMFKYLLKNEAASKQLRSRFEAGFPLKILQRTLHLYMHQPAAY
jgi:hypothetical protein